MKTPPGKSWSQFADDLIKDIGFELDERSKQNKMSEQLETNLQDLWIAYEEAEMEHDDREKDKLSRMVERIYDRSMKLAKKFDEKFKV